MGKERLRKSQKGKKDMKSVLGKEETMKKENKLMVVVMGVVFVCGLMLSVNQLSAQEKPIELTYATPICKHTPLFNRRSALD